MKKVIAVTALASAALMASASAFAVGGARIEGLGSVMTLDEADGAPSVNGFGARFGYDINGIVGFNIDARKFNEDTAYYSADSFMVGATADVGWAFPITDGNYVKPYGFIGTRYNKVDGEVRSDYCSDDCSITESDTTIVYGLGIRAVVLDTISAGIEYEKQDFFGVDTGMTTFTVGYKF